MEEYLEEMLMLAARAEEYNQFMLAKMGDAASPVPLSAAHHNAFRRVSRDSLSLGITHQQ